jgi:PKD repeat protein
MVRTGLAFLVVALVLVCGAAPVLAHEVIYDFSMDTDPGWTASPGSTWSWGSGPAGYAAAAHTGANWYAFRRDSTAGGVAYPAMAEEQTLTTTAIDCTGLHSVRLDFWRIVYTVSADDHIAVRVSNDGADWITVWQQGGPFTYGRTWEWMEYDISAIADDQATVYIQWVMGPTVTDGIGQGWSIDDVSIVADPTPDLVYSFPLTTDPGWTKDGAWAFGTPTGGGTGDPSAAHTGNNVLGYNLSGNYVDSMAAQSLTTTALNCSQLTHTTLKFWRQLAVESATWDHASVEVSTNGSTWTPIWANPLGSIQDGQWGHYSYDISGIADGQATVYIRWVMGPTDGSVTYGGWNIDDIEIWGCVDVYGHDLGMPPIQVLAWLPYSDQSQEYPNAVHALSTFWYRTAITESYTLDPDVLAAELRGKQIFLVPEPELATSAELIAAGTAFADVLQDFVYNGGTVIVSSELVYAPWPADRGGFLNATGLMSVTQMGLSPDSTGGTLTVTAPSHYLASGVSGTFTGPNSTAAYAVGPEATSVVEDSVGNTIVAAQDYGWGSAVLVGFDYWASNASVDLVLSNAATYPRGRYWPYLWDDNAVKRSLEQAASRLHLNWWWVGGGSASADDWQLYLDTYDWDLYMVDAPSSQASDDWAALMTRIAAGKKTLMQSYDLESMPDVQAGFGISAADGVTGVPPLYNWDDTSTLFHSPNEVSTLTDWEDHWLISAELLTVGADATALAGFTATPTAGQAAIVLGNDGRTLYDGYLWDEGSQDADYDGVEDTVELLMNQITMLLRRPEADFGASWSGTYGPLPVTFTDLSEGVVEWWSWDFGDGGTSAEQNPVHTYTSAGSFTVSLRAGNSYNSATETKLNLVVVTDVVPAADFEASPTTGDAPLEVTFTDLSANAPTEWAWDFGDAGTSTEQDPTHTYTTVGSFTVSLTATNVAGSDTEEKLDYIEVTSPIAAAFTAANAAGVVPLTVTFTDETTGDPDGWSWDFGDGATSTQQNPSHTYGDPGYYTVTLTAAKGLVTDVAEQPGCVAAGFVDTAPDFWAFHYILACASANVVQGYYGNQYKPADPVTRGQMAVYIARALAGGDEAVPDPPDTPTFTDVLTDHWAYRYVEYVASLDVVQGYGGGIYKPDVIVNRGQMAVYIARSVVDPPGDANVPEASPSDPAFPDVTATNDWGWCYKYVQYIATLDPVVTTGYPDGLYHPERQVTRDQMAVYVQRAFDLPMYAPAP